jgi:hypothetical protein
MNSPQRKAIAPSTRPALELISLARLSHEQARQNLRGLLLANPNHFGSVTDSSFKAVLKIQADTAYESIGCLGYNQRLKELWATIRIKQGSGYSGQNCLAGSEEYVRFFLSYDGGSTWQDQGFKVVNVFDAPGPKPVECAVSLPIRPNEEFRILHHLPKVRAILSWNTPPPADLPNWTPVWGNVLDGRVQINGLNSIVLSALLFEDRVQQRERIARIDDPAPPIEAGTSETLGPVERRPLCAGWAPPPDRTFAYQRQ